jgi:hypothetical protein
MCSPLILKVEDKDQKEPNGFYALLTFILKSQKN